MVMLNENLQKFKQFSAEVVVVAPESKHQIKSVVDRPRADGGLGGVDFPIVSDINGMVRNLQSIHMAIPFAVCSPV